MKRKQITVKRQIQKKIELRNQQIAFLDNKGGPKKNMSAMNERDRERIYGSGKPAINVELLTRDEMRMGKVENDEILPILEVKLPISIIITAYQTQEFIEECLDSIENQTYFINNDDFEVLVGIDGCMDTLNKVLEIRHKYRNLRVFVMENNVGTYVTSNTLLSIVKNKNILRFDSDDVMRPEMINEIMTYSNDYNVVRFHFIQFEIKEGVRFENNIKYFAQGVIFFTREVLDKLGGYMPWKCAGDSDFLKRAEELGEVKLIPIPLFYRRLHGNNLIFKYNGKDINRKKYNKLVGQHTNISIEPIINKYNEI